MCDPGYFAQAKYYENGGLQSLECLPCVKGYYTKRKGLWKSCVQCPMGQSSAADASTGCSRKEYTKPQQKVHT